jgi:hypothetical protein
LVGVWLPLTMRVVLPRLRAGLGRAAWRPRAVSVIAASPGLRVAETELRDTAIVTAPGGTSVRFEPLDRHRALRRRTRHASTSPRSARTGCRCDAATAAAAGSSGNAVERLQ